MVRDTIVRKVCGFMIDHVASEWYRTRFEMVVDFGIREYERRLENAEEPH
jgi:hypothetical protein